MGKEVIQLMGKFKSECGNTIQWLIKKVRKPKASAQQSQQQASNAQPSGIDVATIAIVLDGEIQEVIRAQDRMAALILSNPEFVEIPDTLPEKPTIGWFYKDGSFWSKDSLMPEKFNPVTPQE